MSTRILEQILQNEEQRQMNSISLIASENIASKRVRMALSSVLTNKYAEGYPGSRYYAGCEYADEVGAFIMADIAHTAGLIAGGVHDNPIEFVDIMTSTTHKTLRGPRGGIILSNNQELGAKIDRALFPGVQGGPLMNIIAAKAAGFEENLMPEFKQYARNVLDNAQILAQGIKDAGGKLVTDGTDNHLMILDCRSFGLDGKGAEKLLMDANILVSVSALIDDTSWIKPSGIRIGTPYITTLGIESMQEFVDILVDCLVTKNTARLGEYTKASANRLFPKFLN